MTTELNRRTFIALLGASAASLAVARPVRQSTPPHNIPTGTPRCFMNNDTAPLPARPKTAAITYLIP